MEKQIKKYSKPIFRVIFGFTFALIVGFTSLQNVINNVGNNTTYGPKLQNYNKLMGYAVINLVAFVIVGSITAAIVYGRFILKKEKSPKEQIAAEKLLLNFKTYRYKTLINSIGDVFVAQVLVVGGILAGSLVYLMFSNVGLLQMIFPIIFMGFLALLLPFGGVIMFFSSLRAIFFGSECEYKISSNKIYLSNPELLYKFTKWAQDFEYIDNGIEGSFWLKFKTFGGDLDDVSITNTSKHREVQQFLLQKFAKSPAAKLYSSSANIRYGGAWTSTAGEIEIYEDYIALKTGNKTRYLSRKGLNAVTSVQIKQKGLNSIIIDGGIIAYRRATYPDEIVLTGLGDAKVVMQHLKGFEG